MQTGVVILGSQVFSNEFPSAHAEVLPGVKWGLIEAFPSPAYWAYQAWANEQQTTPINYKLGSTLQEEVGACLLGGHGIPASVGLAAFSHLKGRGAFSGSVPSEQELFSWLSEPLDVSGRPVRYRFARQKARYLSAALLKLDSGMAPLTSGRALRDWLTSIPALDSKQLPGLRETGWMRTMSRFWTYTFCERDCWVGSSRQASLLSATICNWSRSSSR